MIVSTTKRKPDYVLRFEDNSRFIDSRNSTICRSDKGAEVKGEGAGRRQIEFCLFPDFVLSHSTTGAHTATAVFIVIEGIRHFLEQNPFREGSWDRRLLADNRRSLPLYSWKEFGMGINSEHARSPPQQPAKPTRHFGGPVWKRRKYRIGKWESQMESSGFPYLS
jgi:hypothetical protein